ncbi:MAG: hypothetical protein K2F94_09835 [Muribaculaceae bacterium]|nr:hypothetical protein [Muribaculaceae bacterium]
MKKYNFEEELPHLIPHFVHVAMGAALIVLSAEILKKICKVHKGLKEIKEGHEEAVT